MKKSLIIILVAIPMALIALSFSVRANSYPAIHVTPSGGPAGSVVALSGENYDSTLSVVWFSDGKNSAMMNQVADGKYKIPETLCPGAETDSCSSNFSVLTTPGIYSIYYRTGDGAATPFVSAKTTFSVTIVDSQMAHPIGTNVKFPDGTVYRINNGHVLAAYTTGNIFQSYKFNKWSDIVQANSVDQSLTISTPMPPRDGTLWNDDGTTYIISEGKARQPFSSAKVFTGYGYSFKYVYGSPVGYLDLYPAMTSSSRIHPDGTLIKNKGTYYIMNGHERLGVPSLAVLESWGYWLEDAVQANSYDLATPSSTILGMRPFDQYRY